MKNQTQYNSGGIGCTGALTILFIGLKLARVIDWSWWLVLSPLWIGAIIFVTILVVLAIIFVLGR